VEGAKIAKDKNALPTKEGEVIVIKTTYGENPHIRKNKILPPTERKYIPTTSAPGGLSSLSTHTHTNILNFVYIVVLSCFSKC
jgi:hypothetical protein